LGVAVATQGEDDECRGEGGEGKEESNQEAETAEGTEEFAPGKVLEELWAVEDGDSDKSRGGKQPGGEEDEVAEHTAALFAIQQAGADACYGLGFLKVSHGWHFGGGEQVTGFVEGGEEGGALGAVAEMGLDFLRGQSRRCGPVEAIVEQGALDSGAIRHLGALSVRLDAGGGPDFPRFEGEIASV